MTREHPEVRLNYRAFSRTWEVVRLAIDGKTITDRWPLHPDDTARLTHALSSPRPAAEGGDDQ